MVHGCATKVMQIGVLSTENEELKAQAKALGAAAEEDAGPPPETEATARIAMFEMQELAGEIKNMKKLRRTIVLEKQKVQKKCARLRNELKKQAKCDIFRAYWRDFCATVRSALDAVCRFLVWHRYILKLQERQEEVGSGNNSLPISFRGAGTPSSAPPASRSKSEGAVRLKPSPPSRQQAQAQASRVSARVASGFRLPQLRGQ